MRVEKGPSRKKKGIRERRVRYEWFLQGIHVISTYHIHESHMMKSIILYNQYTLISKVLHKRERTRREEERWR